MQRYGFMLKKQAKPNVKNSTLGMDKYSLFSSVLSSILRCTG